MRTAFLLLATAVSCLGGCETYYKRPTTGPTASIRFTGNYAYLLTQYADESCSLGSSDGIMGHVGRPAGDPLGVIPSDVSARGNSLAMPGYVDRQDFIPIERTIRADRPFVFTTWRVVSTGVSGVGLTSTTCSSTYSFVPSPGAQYEVNYRESPSACGVVAYRLRVTGDTVEKMTEPSFRKAAKQCPGVR